MFFLIFFLASDNAAKCRKERPKKPRKVKRRMSDVGKAANDNIHCKNKQR